MRMLINSVFHTGVQKNCKVEIFNPCGDICIILNMCLIQSTVMWFWLEFFHVGRKKIDGHICSIHTCNTCIFFLFSQITKNHHFFPIINLCYHLAVVFLHNIVVAVVIILKSDLHLELPLIQYSGICASILLNSWLHRIKH